MTKDEHLQWCKNRAIELLESGEYQQAIVSMMSDMSKHDELKEHIGLNLGMMLMIGGHLSSKNKIREWILGFN